jgi:hypothetical protein
MPQGKRSLWRLGRGYKNNIKVDLTELVLEGVDSMNLPRDIDRWRVFVNTVMNLRFP